MARETLNDNLAFNFGFMSGYLGAARVEDMPTYALTEKSHLSQYIEATTPGGYVRLPPLGEGKFFIITNTGSVDLDVETANGMLVSTLPPGGCNLFHTEGASWKVLVTSGVTYSVFGPEGPGASDGLVPSPGAAQPSIRFLGSDGGWHITTDGGILDGFAFITDGTNTATASGADTFKLRSSSGKITVTVTNNQVTHGDNADFSVNEAAVDHNSLLNYSANRHIDHTSVSIATGSGLTGGGTIAATRTINFDFPALAALVGSVASTDVLPLYDLSTTTHVKTTVGALAAGIDHNALVNYDANRHIDHTAVSISTATGLSGGGTIASTRTISLDFSALPTQAEAMATGDLFAFWDLSGTIHKKISWSSLNAALDHNTLTNYSANRHIDHTAVSISAGGGLTGGGDISTTRTLSLNITGQGAPAGGIASGDEFILWDISASVFAKISFSTMVAAIDHNSLLNYSANRHIDHTAVTITANNGLTGGGDISANRTIGMTSNQRAAGVSFIIDGGGSVITTGNKRGFQVPYSGTITSWSIGLDQSGSIVIDVWKDTQANYPPVVGDTITASAKPTVTTATNATSSTLTAWTTAVTAGDWLFFNVDSVTTATWACINLAITKT